MKIPKYLLWELIVLPFSLRIPFGGEGNVEFHLRDHCGASFECLAGRKGPTPHVDVHSAVTEAFGGPSVKGSALGEQHWLAIVSLDQLHEPPIFVHLRYMHALLWLVSSPCPPGL